MAEAKAKRPQKRKQPVYEDRPIYRKPKFPIYQALYNLNAAFHSIAFEIERLDDYEAIPPDTLRLYTATAQELKSAMNHHILDVLLGREERDWYRYGKDRRTQEAILERS